MLQTLIVDDEKRGRELLKMILTTNCPEVKIIGEAANIKEAQQLIVQHEPDLVLLDIEMPGGSGFDLLTKFDEINFEIIFITAFDKYAIKAIKFSAMDYILKPVDEEELVKAIKRAEENYNRKSNKERAGNLVSNAQKPVPHQKIGLTSGEGLEFIEIKNILRCEADGKYTSVFLTDGKKLLVSKNLKEFEDLLTENNFFRIHHSHLVNLDYIKKYQSGRGGYVVMSDGSTITVSQRKKDDFLSSLKKI
ncbi:MAG: response regulator transcription factor [Bacteroidetes bacterium]|jgi:two-component system LytT family response regulator|nr:response regulator transcription factor [Bacteroidota bacterium]